MLLGGSWHDAIQHGQLTGCPKPIRIFATQPSGRATTYSISNHPVCIRRAT